MYPIATGLPFCVQETTIDANFTAANEYGRARVTIGAPGAQVFVSAKLYGTLGNGYFISLIDRGVAVSATVATQVGSTVEVVLRRSASAILATPEEVATAINARNLPVRASWSGTTPVSPASSVSLTGGANPALIDPSGSRFEWSRTTGQTGGFFYFENFEDTLVITGVSAKFSGLGGAIPLVIETVNLDAGLLPVGSSAIAVKRAEVSSSSPDFSLTGMDGIPLLPYTVLRVTCAAVGSVRVTAQRLRRHPYA